MEDVRTGRGRRQRYVSLMESAMISTEFASCEREAGGSNVQGRHSTISSGGCSAAAGAAQR